MTRRRLLVASRQAGELYGLKILADEYLAINGQNATRFVIVSKKPIYVKDAHKISIFFELHHESGTLYNMLSHIIYNGLNMTKIESRPITGKNWQYRFFCWFWREFKGQCSEECPERNRSGSRQNENFGKLLKIISIMGMKRTMVRTAINRTIR